MMNRLQVTFNVVIPDTDRFRKAVANYYEMDVKEVFDGLHSDLVDEFVSHHLTSVRSKTHVFEIEGIDTDGPFVQSIDGSSELSLE